MSPWRETWTCEQILEHLEAFVEGKLAEHESQNLSSHLDDCSGCAAQAQLAGEIHKELRSLPELDTPTPVLQSILDQTVRSQSSGLSFRALRSRWPQPLWGGLAAAALALVLGLGVMWQLTSQPEPPDAATIAQATAEARYALAKTGLLTRQAGRVIRDQTLRDQIVVPTTRGLSLALGSSADSPSGTSSEGVDDV